MKKCLVLLMALGYSVSSHAIVVGMDAFIAHAQENMEQGLAGTLAVLGTGITIVGVFKGYGYIKQGVKKS